MTPKVVLITGASSGIGEGIARTLAAADHTVVLDARRLERLEAIAEQLRVTGATADAQRLDVTDLEDVQTFVAGAEERCGRVDVLVGNAGLMPLSDLERGHVDEWNQMIDVNIRGVLHGIHAILPALRRAGGGHVITVASVGAHRVSPTAAVYCATKFAAWAITEGLRQELDPSIRVTTVSPGVVETPIAATITDPAAAEAMRTYRAASIPPSAIGEAVAYAIDQPDGVDVTEIIVQPVAQR